LLSILGVLWTAYSILFIPELFPASGAVLVCGALISELLIQILPWRQDNELNKYLRADFVESTIVAKSGTSIQLHAYTDEKYSPFHNNNSPSEIITFTNLVKRDFSGITVETPLRKLEPIFLLYQLAKPNHTAQHKITQGTNQNPYIHGVELSGWEVRRTLRMVNVYFTMWITTMAVFGTLVWGYAKVSVEKQSKKAVQSNSVRVVQLHECSCLAIYHAIGPHVHCS